jgi:hypothetical protein
MTGGRAGYEIAHVRACSVNNWPTTKHARDGGPIAVNTAQLIAPSAETRTPSAAGVIDCARCRERIYLGQEWDLGHVDGDGMRYAGLEHRHARDCSEGETERRLATASSARCISSRRGAGRESGEPGRESRLAAGSSRQVS